MECRAFNFQGPCLGEIPIYILTSLLRANRQPVFDPLLRKITLNFIIMLLMKQSQNMGLLSLCFAVNRKCQCPKVSLEYICSFSIFFDFIKKDSYAKNDIKTV